MLITIFFELVDKRLLKYVSISVSFLVTNVLLFYLFYIFTLLLSLTNCFVCLKIKYIYFLKGNADFF